MESFTVQIGNVNINGLAALAPMAGAADRAFRELCMEYGASYTVTELISAKGIARDDRGSRELLEIGDKAHPAAIQLFGDECESMAAAAVKSLGYSPDIIDINMGCPAPKVSGHGSGCALMRDPELAYGIIKSVVEAVDIPVTVKIRAGWDENSINASEIAKAAESAGAKAVAVHGRTKKQMYAPPVNLEIIRRVKESVSIPVIGNGDIKSPEDALNMLSYTKCDMVMIGRGALGNPWIFERTNAYLQSGVLLPEVSLEEKLKVMTKHAQLICSYKGEYIGMREMRKHAAWYLKGIRGAAAYRRETNELISLDDIKKLAENILLNNENQH